MTEFVNIADLKDPNDPEGRTYREINNATQHRFNVGQLVEVDDGVRLFVAKQTRDCDGTPLYYLTPHKGDYKQERVGFANRNWSGGCPEDSMKAI
jgi:hypothetical protein